MKTLNNKEERGSKEKGRGLPISPRKRRMKARIMWSLTRNMPMVRKTALTRMPIPQITGSARG